MYRQYRGSAILTLICGVVIANEGKKGIEWDKKTTKIVAAKIRDLLKNPPTQEFDLRGNLF